MLMPVLTIKQGAVVAVSPLHIPKNTGSNLEVEVRDPFTASLGGYQVNFRLTGPGATNGAITFSGSPDTFIRGHKQGGRVQRITQIDGRIQLSITTPNVGAATNWVLEVSYQSNFYTDTAFDLPVAGENLALTERKLYLNALRYSAGTSTGATQTQTLNLTIDP